MVRLESELTIYQAAAIKPQVMALLAAGGDIELDLSGVTEFDSSGFQLLALLRRDTLAAGHRLRIAGISAPVRELLDLYGATADFVTESDRAQP